MADLPYPANILLSRIGEGGDRSTCNMCGNGWSLIYLQSCNMCWKGWNLICLQHV